jgi:hypothetical protein
MTCRDVIAIQKVNSCQANYKTHVEETFAVLWRQGCQIFLDTMYQNWENIYKIKTKLPNRHYKFLKGIKYNNIFHSKFLQNLPKSELLVLKYHLATLYEGTVGQK